MRKSPCPKRSASAFSFLQITLRQATQLKDQAAGGGALATVDMAADHDGQVRFLRVGRHGWSQVGCIVEALQNFGQGCGKFGHV